MRADSPLIQCGPGLISGLGIISGLSLLFVLVLVSRGFSLSSLVFPSPQKTTFPNLNSIYIIIYCQALYHEPLAWEIAQALVVTDNFYDQCAVLISLLRSDLQSKCLLVQD